MPLYKSLMYWILLLVSSSSILSLKYAFLFVSEMSANFTSYIIQNIYIDLSWILYHLLFSPLFRCKETKHHSSNQGLFCFNSCRLRLSSAEVCIFFLMCSQVLYTPSSTFTFSKAANLFEISIWYLSLTSRSLSFRKLNLCLPNLCAACYISLNFAVTRKWSVSESVPLKFRTSSLYKCHFLSINTLSILLWVLH